MRVLTLAHGHAELRPGGAEAAALALHRRLRARPGVEPVLVARASPADVGHGAPFGLHAGRPDEVLAVLPGSDPFLHESLSLSQLERAVEELVARFRPDVLHVQHFDGWSLDASRLFARAGVPSVLTLHEFLLPCRRDGQMVTTDGRLCDAPSPTKCARCFPEHAAGHFHLRRAVLLDRLAAVNRFAAPSRFLGDRHVAWGLPADRLAVIDYPLSPDLLVWASAPEPPRPAPDGRVRFGFFGQVNPYKGVDLLLEAAALLPPALRARALVDVHGASAGGPYPGLSERLEALAAACGGRARLMGGYPGGTAPALMRGYDWVVVPSVWWENSPVVIQEARAAGRPVLAADIGGMAEKVGGAHAAPGRLFAARDPRALAAAMAEIVAAGGASPSSDASPVPFDEEGRVDAYLDLYRAAIAEGPRA